MNRAVVMALGGVGVGGALYLAYDWLFGDHEGEPARPLSSPVPSTGNSGIAQTPDEVEALARVIASEAGSASSAVQCAIGWVVRNHFHGKSIYDKQYPWRAQKGSNPPFSSARSATDATRQMARDILAADQSTDPTGGATSFFEPRMQDAFAKAGALARAGETGSRVIDGVKLSDITRFKAYRKDADAIRASWSKGSTLYATAGPFEMWGSAKLFARGGGQVQAIAGRIPRAEEIWRRHTTRRGLLSLGARR